jgi:hypothetical protein
MFKGPQLLKTQCRRNGSATLVERKVSLPIDAPIRACVPIRLLEVHQPLSMEPTLFLLLLRAHGRVNHVVVEEA